MQNHVVEARKYAKDNAAVPHMMTLGRIAYLALETPREGQASYTHIHEIVGGLRNEGWTVDLFAAGSGGASAATSFARRIVAQLSLQARLLPRLRNYQALYVRNHFMAWPSVMTARLLGVPVIHELNGQPTDILVTYPALARIGPLLLWLYRSQFRAASELIAVTDGLGDWARSFAGHDRITVIPNGANTDLFCPEGPAENNQGYYVIFVGGIVAWHGIATMLKAIDEPAWPANVRLIVVGDGILRNLLEAARANPRLVWLGAKPYVDIPALLRGSIAALCVIENPSGRSATGVAPLKLYEAMACGVPTIVSDLPYQSELVGKLDAGLIVPAGDAAGLAAAVAQLAANPDRAQAMGKNGATYVRDQASWRHRASQTGQVVARAIERSSRSH